MAVNAASSAQRRPLLAPGIFGLGLFAVVALFGANYRWHTEPRLAPFAGDFIQEYVGAYLILHGDYSRFYDIRYAQEIEHDPAVTGFPWQGGTWLPMIYPPFYYLLLAPLYLLPIRAAALVWLAGMTAALVVSLVLLARHYPQRVVLLWALPAGAFFPPLLESLASGQKGSLVLLIFTATYLLLDRGKPLAAGLVFGLVTFKPQLALVLGLAMLGKRQWAFVAGSVTTTLVLVSLCFVVGPDVCRQYFEVSLRMGSYIETSGYPLQRMHSWYGFFRLLLPDWPLPRVQLAYLLASLVTLGVLVRLLRGNLSFGQRRFALQFSSLVLATLLLSPHLLTYDLSVLLLPLVVLTLLLTAPAEALPGQARPTLWMLACLYVLVGISSHGALLLRVQLSVLLMFALLVQLTRLAVWLETPALMVTPSFKVDNSTTTGI